MSSAFVANFRPIAISPLLTQLSPVQLLLVALNGFKLNANEFEVAMERWGDGGALEQCTAEWGRRRHSLIIQFENFDNCIINFSDSLSHILAHTKQPSCSWCKNTWASSQRKAKLLKSQVHATSADAIWFRCNGNVERDGTEKKEIETKRNIYWWRRGMEGAGVGEAFFSSHSCYFHFGWRRVVDVVLLNSNTISIRFGIRRATHLRQTISHSGIVSLLSSHPIALCFYFNLWLGFVSRMTDVMLQFSASTFSRKQTLFALGAAAMKANDFLFSLLLCSFAPKLKLQRMVPN